MYHQHCRIYIVNGVSKMETFCKEETDFTWTMRALTPTFSAVSSGSSRSLVAKGEIQCEKNTAH